MKNLVVYYSRTGNTEKIADEITGKTDADIQKIVDRKNRMGVWGFITGAFDALLSRETSIRELSCRPSEYDMIIIGTPIWAGKITPAVRTFINRFKNSLEKIAVFTTAGKEDCSNVKKEIEELTGKKTLSSLSILEEDIKNDNYSTKINDFVSSIVNQNNTA